MGLFFGNCQSGGGEPALNEVQVITFDNAPTAGHWTITLDGQTTAALRPTASAADIQTAIRALSNVGAGNCTVTELTPGTEFQVEFIDGKAGTAFGQMTIDDDNLRYGASNEVQTITWYPSGPGPTGTVRMTGNSTFVDRIDGGGMDAASLQENMDTMWGLDPFGDPNVVVTGSYNGPFTMTFSGAGVTGQDFPLMGIDGGETTLDPAPIFYASADGASSLVTASVATTQEGG